MLFILGLFIAFTLGPYIFIGTAVCTAILVSVAYDVLQGDTHEGDAGDNSMTTYPYPPINTDNTSPGDTNNVDIK